MSVCSDDTSWGEVLLRRPIEVVRVLRIVVRRAVSFWVLVRVRS